jgi:hypothetical protein
MGEKIPSGESTPSLDENKSSPNSWYPVTTDSAMNEKATSLEENDTSLNESRPPRTSYDNAYRIVAVVEIYIFVTIFASFAILKQYSPDNGWCDYPQVVFFLDYALLFALWRFLSGVEKIALLDWPRDSPAYAAAAAAGDLFLFRLIMYPQHGQRGCIQNPRS